MSLNPLPLIINDSAENEQRWSVESADGQTLADRVFEDIQEAIVTGSIAPGTKITEPGLAKQYGISRGPLREAMRRLEGRHLVTRIPHVGARVVSLTIAELLELYEVREAMEGMACRLAARQMPLELLCGELYYLVRMYRYRFSATSGRPQRAFTEHHRIVDAIEQRDEELAEMLMRRHIRASRDNVERRFLEAETNKFKPLIPQD